MPSAESDVIEPICLDGEDATRGLAERIAARLQAGDLVLLDGPVGAGKSFLARHLLRTLQTAAGTVPEDVPSPTFTIVQTYFAGPLEVWHCDLYRLGDPGELAELGLEGALGRALVLVEWPDRLPPEISATGLTLELRHDADADDRRWLRVRAGAGVRPALVEALEKMGLRT